LLDERSDERGRQIRCVRELDDRGIEAESENAFAHDDSFRTGQAASLRPMLVSTV
jgi:hypothetical protein